MMTTMIMNNLRRHHQMNSKSLRKALIELGEEETNEYFMPRCDEVGDRFSAQTEAVRSLKIKDI